MANTYTIQFRRGMYSDFDTSKIRPGEPVAILGNDPSVPSGKALYVAFAANDVRRLCSIEDITEMANAGEFVGPLEPQIEQNKKDINSLKEDIDDLNQGEISKIIDWREGFINGLGIIQADTPSEKFYVHGHKRLAQNTKVKYNLFSTNTISAVAIGTEAKPIKMLIPGTVPGGGYTGGEYTVLAPYEDLWFVTRKSDITDNQGTSIIIDTSNCNIAQNLKNENAISIEWKTGYVNTQGLIVGDNAYCHSQLLTIPPYMEISFKSRTAKDIATISEYDSNGSFLRTIRIGTGNMETVKYVSNKETYIKICVLFTNQYSSLSGYTVTMKDYKGEEQNNIILKYGYVGMTGLKEFSTENPYYYTNPIELMQGQTIEYYSSGSASVWGLSECDTNGNFISGIQQGNSKYIHRSYTAERHMFVRVCAKVSNNANGQITHDPIVAKDDLKNIKVYFKSFHYSDVKNKVLYQKKITLIGDSLAYGNILGNDAVWLRDIALKYDMDATNMGINGNPVAIQTKETQISMVERYKNIPKSDYIVLIGGANDKRLDVPIGQINDAAPNTFMGALNIIIDGIRSMHPKSKLLFLTNYNRFPSLNSLGKTDIDYVNAMIDVCRNKCVKCYDNYHESGIYFQDSNLVQWQDEGISIGLNENHHLSSEAYKYIENRYETILAQL